MAAELEFPTGRAARAELIDTDGGPVEGDGTDGSGWRRRLEEGDPCEVKPAWVEDAGAWAGAWREAAGEVAARLAAAGDGDGAWWAFWGRAVVGRSVSAGMRPLGPFVEERVYEFGEVGGPAEARGSAAAGAKGDRELGWLCAGRDGDGRPNWTVWNRSGAVLTIPMERGDGAGEPGLRCARLDRVDGRELVVAWLLPRTRERPEAGVVVLVITRAPAGALRRLREPGAARDHFHRALDRLEYALCGAPERTWTLVAFRAAHLHLPSERQAALHRLLEPRVPRPALIVDPAGSPEAAGALRATAARRLALYPALALCHGPLLLLRTFVYDLARPEPSFGYDACDYLRDSREFEGDNRYYELGDTAFEALAADRLEPAQAQLCQQREKLEFETWGAAKAWPRDALSRYRSRLADRLGDDVLLVRHRRSRNLPNEKMSHAGFGSDLTYIQGTFHEELWYRLRSDARDRMAFESYLEYLPDLDREHIYLNFLAPLDEDNVFRLRWVVLQIRVPLHLAWQGLPLGQLFGLRSGHLGMLTSEDGVRWFQEPRPGAPLRTRRLGLGDRIPLTGAGPWAMGLRLDPMVLSLPPDERLFWPPRGPWTLRPEPVTELVVTGAPDAAALVALLAPEAASEP